MNFIPFLRENSELAPLLGSEVPWLCGGQTTTTRTIQFHPAESFLLGKAENQPDNQEI
jgi:hypothetical protein